MGPVNGYSQENGGASGSESQRAAPAVRRGAGVEGRAPHRRPVQRRRLHPGPDDRVFLAQDARVLRPARPRELPRAGVVGLTEAQARALLPNFTINIQDGPSSSIPKGRISSQLPLADAKVIPGSSITLTESSGAGNTAIPINLVGLSLADARSALTSAGLLVAQTIPTDSNQAPGTVLAVNPSPGSILPAGAGVVLQIASGSLQVPELVGLSEVQAITTLTQAGFLVRTATAYDSTQATQIILAQAPSAGTTQNIGSTVTITVNTQPTN